MNLSQENYLQVVAPYLSHQLVTPKAFSQIQTVARMLPPLSDALLECRLGANSSNVDFSVSVTSWDGSREILAGLNPTMNMPDIILTNPVWRRIRDFCLHWYEPNSLLSENVDCIWLEFDIDGQLPKMTVPSFFVRLKHLMEKSNSNKEYDIRDQEQLIETTLNLLYGNSVSPKIKQNIDICLNFLPVNSQVLYIGAMLSRQLEAVRVNVTGIPEEELFAYLTKIGWKHSVSEVKEIIQILSGLSDTIVLNFDVGNVIFPKIGIECELNKKDPRIEPRWQLFLDYLVEKGLCTSEKRDAFLSWTGYSEEKTHPELWPSNLSKISSFFGGRRSSIFFRRLNHIKIVYQPDSSLEAKGYLSFGHAWIN
ncbi:hypothetical protein PQG02_34725 (plasmid) [Nostoc sp. UHCC 0926]|uniref:hypothetical protein n=1 Tax=Nostoc sp. UHCC 0926 TaxID=3025190 RepID=UPI00236194C1|nr:hypothetical protein [Nostoc sp. UHCC 0926]WDD36980.1 hypothetical protein PQG02_34725 [Nostoc sp. UHCC 0926]